MNNNRFCTCSYYKTKAYGLNPQNHNKSCPMFKQENNICKEEWLNESDKEKYNKYYTKEKLLEMKITSSRGGKISINKKIIFPNLKLTDFKGKTYYVKNETKD